MVFVIQLIAGSIPSVYAQDRVGNISVRVQEVSSLPLSIISLIVLAVLLLVLLGIIFYLLYSFWKKYQKYPKAVKAKIDKKMYEEKSPTTYVMEHIIIEDEVEKHLKEEERIIVRLLRQREGKCEQGTLCIISNFSKATLSRLLVELEQRGIIRKEKQGKKNMVYLRI